MQTLNNSTCSDLLRLAGTALRLSRALDQQVRQSQSGDGLTLAELGLLGQIDHGHDLPSVLARELHLDPPRVTRLSDHLVSLRYIERAADTNDRRLCRLQLTEAGVGRLAQARLDLKGIMEKLLDGLSPDERAGLELGLEGVRRALETT